MDLLAFRDNFEKRFSKSKLRIWGNDYIQSSNVRKRLAFDGGQKVPPQNIPLWNEDIYILS